MIHASLSGSFAPLAYFKAVSWLDQTSPPTLDIKNHYTKKNRPAQNQYWTRKNTAGKKHWPVAAKTPTSCVGKHQ